MTELEQIEYQRVPRFVFFIAYFLIYFITLRIMRPTDNPMLGALPSIVGFPMIPWAVKMGKPARQKEFLRSLDIEEARALVAIERVATSILLFPTGIMLGFMTTDAMTWFSEHMLLALDSGAIFAMPQYPALLQAGAITFALALQGWLSSPLGQFLARDKVVLWDEYASLNKMSYPPKWVRAIFFVLTLASVVGLALLLPCGTSVGKNGITIRKFGNLRPTVYQWQEVKSAQHIEEGYKIQFSDGSQQILDYSVSDRRSLGAVCGIAEYLEKHGVKKKERRGIKHAAGVDR